MPEPRLTQAERLAEKVEEPGERTCVRCGQPFSGRPEKTFCSDACRRKAWGERQALPPTAMATAPTLCERCGGTEFDHRVCVRCAWRPPCPTCGTPISGRKDKTFCDAKCKMKGWYAAHPKPREAAGAIEVLGTMSESEFRETVAAVAELREQRRASIEERPPRAGGRLRVRWGEYQPRA